jgi:hypothetical protein
MMNPSRILTMESFLSDIGGLIAAQEDLTIAEIIGALEITKAELLESLFEVDEDEEA